MDDNLPLDPRYRNTMQRLEAAKRATTEGADYWMAREISGILGYETWRRFEDVIGRATAAFRQNGVEPSHHIAEAVKMMGLGRGAQRQSGDYYLSRAACYLIVMNGDPTKPEIAAGQAYFAVQARRMELADERSEDVKRLELREKVSQGHRRVSGVASDAGVRNQMQGVFHDARYRGLYGMGLKDVRRLKGIGDKEQLYDLASSLELSMHDFQMNLAADVIAKEAIRGEQRAIIKNQEVAERVRKAMRDSGSDAPENLPLAEPIKEVRKRLTGKKKLPKPSPRAT